MFIFVKVVVYVLVQRHSAVMFVVRKVWPGRVLLNVILLKCNTLTFIQITKKNIYSRIKWFLLNESNNTCRFSLSRRVWDTQFTVLSCNASSARNMRQGYLRFYNLVFVHSLYTEWYTVKCKSILPKCLLLGKFDLIVVY